MATCAQEGSDRARAEQVGQGEQGVADQRLSECRALELQKTDVMGCGDQSAGKQRQDAGPDPAKPRV